MRKLSLLLLTGLVLSAESPSGAPLSAYILGAEDQISIRVLQAPELIDKPIRVDGTGYIDLPYAGRVKAAGETIESLRLIVAAKMTSIVRDPEISITVDEFRSQPVSVIGAVNTPGVHQLRGRKTLIEMLSLAGGPRQDSGSIVTITRQQENGPTGIRGETLDASKGSMQGFWMASLDLTALMEGRSPKSNVLIQPNDVIAVSKARLVYVMGDVPKTGGFVLSTREGVSVLEALALAGGMNRTASPQRARILRASSGEPVREEVPVNLQRIIDGKDKDRELNPEDILYIPSSLAKRASFRALEAAIQVAAGVAIWRPF